jgi:hypothetical protein
MSTSHKATRPHMPNPAPNPDAKPPPTRPTREQLLEDLRRSRGAPEDRPSDHTQLPPHYGNNT